MTWHQVPAFTLSNNKLFLCMAHGVAEATGLSNTSAACLLRCSTSCCSAKQCYHNMSCRRLSPSFVLSRRLTPRPWLSWRSKSRLWRRRWRQLSAGRQFLSVRMRVCRRSWQSRRQRKRHCKNRYAPYRGSIPKRLWRASRHVCADEVPAIGLLMCTWLRGGIRQFMSIVTAGICKASTFGMMPRADCAECTHCSLPSQIRR